MQWCLCACICIWNFMQPMKYFDKCFSSDCVLCFNDGIFIHGSQKGILLWLLKIMLNDFPLIYFIAICFMLCFDICLVYNCLTQSGMECMQNVCETEIIKCVSRSSVGKDHSSPHSLPRCSVYACWCLWMTPIFKYSFKSVTAGVVLVCAHACGQGWMCVYLIW